MIENFTHDIENNILQFNGNSNLKSPNQCLHYTKKHVEELIKCQNDIFYFANNYYYILDVDQGMIKIPLRDYQYDMINHFKNNRFSIVLASRRIGKSCCTEIFILHYLIFNPDKSVLILANKEEQAKDLLRKIKLAYELLPMWMKLGIKTWNVKSIILENGSKANAFATSSTSSRGATVSLLYIDECISGDSLVTIRNKKTLETKSIQIQNLYNNTSHKNGLYEVLTPSGFKNYDGVNKLNKSNFIHIILKNCLEIKCSDNHKIDTINGYVYAKNLTVGDTLITKFENIKIQSIKTQTEDIELYDLINVKDYRHRFFANDIVVSNCAFIDDNIWEDFLSSVYPTISSGKETKIIYTSTINGMNHFYKDWNDAIENRNKFKPFRVDWWQIPHYDEQWKEETIANIGKIKFEQEFGNSPIGSSYTLIEANVINQLKHLQSLPNSNLHSKISDRLKNYIKIYEEPIKNHIYVAGVDSAKMTEENAGDALGIQILDISSFPIKQVATIFIKEGISYLQAPELVYKIGKYYNEATLFIENNEIGQEVANMLHFDLEYENVYFEKGSLPGFRTTKKTKRLGCTNLKLLVENNKLILNDFDTISQLSTFIKKKLSYQAESGYQDDLVMALIAALYFILAQGMDVDLIESTSDFGKKIICNMNDGKEEEEDVIINVMPDEDFNPRQKGDWDWL